MTTQTATKKRIKGYYPAYLQNGKVTAHRLLAQCFCGGSKASKDAALASAERELLANPSKYANYTAAVIAY